MFPLEQQDPQTQQAVNALAEACQQLARQMRFFALGGAQLDPALLEPVEKLVQRSTAEFQLVAQSARASTAGSPTPGKVLALRMLQSGAPECEPGLVRRNQDRPPSSKHTLVLRGSEGILSAPDLVSFLSMQRKTGLLEIKAATEQFVLEFEQGQIAHVQSDTARDGERLGDILVGTKAISRDDLESARKRNARGRLGEVLVRSGLVSEEQLFNALHQQIQQLFQRLFSSRLESFSFWSGTLIHAQERLRLNPNSLLLECARLKDEQTWFDAPK